MKGKQMPDAGLKNSRINKRLPCKRIICLQGSL